MKYQAFGKMYELPDMGDRGPGFAVSAVMLLLSLFEMFMGIALQVLALMALWKYLHS